MEIPGNLIRQIRQGRVVLFLGAGATIGAATPDGGKPPIGDDLRDLIDEHFLGGNYPAEGLSWVAELAISSTSLFEVQDFIAKQFNTLKPSKFHLLLPTFRWRGIATTNYDRIVETAYTNAKNKIQTVVPFLSNKDRVDEKLRNLSNVGLLKLHGCITLTHEPKLPLILTADQYATYREGRSRVFQMLEEWGSENPVVFIGHKLHDPNLRSILLELTQKIPSRPAYYLVRPGISTVERDFWVKKNFSVLDGTFEDFLLALDSKIDKAKRPLLKRLEADHAVQIRFIINDDPSSALLEFLERDFEYVHEGIRSATSEPARFYSGFGLDWFPILNKLDVRRGLTDRILEDVIIRPEEDRPSQVELYVIKAEAGAGKSVLLRRIAWESAVDAGVLCLKGNGTLPLSLQPLRELSAATGERIFLFIDNAADNSQLIRRAIDFARAKNIRLTAVTTERYNEWNLRCDDLNEYLSDQYPLRYLNRKEVEALVKLLTEHNALGPNLTSKTFVEQVSEFEKRAGRQLLVALHEATKGRPFEEILLDEYNNIAPPAAQRLYLSVCVLNRLRVSVRAGLISRVHSIPFKDFADRLFKPLEHVIYAAELPWGDYGYRTRHSEIAQIVFDQVLVEPTDRFDEYIRILRYLNPMYSTDIEALRGMLRARSVHELFPDFEDAKAIYEAGEDILGDDPYLLQQRANYERVRSNGNLALAQSLLEKAKYISPSDTSILHTLAEVLRSRAEASDKILERKRYRNEALAALQTIPPLGPSARYAAITLLKLSLDEATDIMNDSSATYRDIDKVVRRVERTLTSTLQRYPGDKYALSVESKFAGMLRDNERSIAALRQARQANPRDPFLSSRLASILVSREKPEEAEQCLREALDGNRGNKGLNYQYAELLRRNLEAPKEQLSYYYRRAFTKWDDNFESQFWYARFAFESQELTVLRESKEIFQKLREIRAPYEERIRIRDVIGSFEHPVQFSGEVTRLEATHGFVKVDGRGNWLFFHETNVSDDEWEDMSSGKRVVFGIGFTLRGPQAIELTPEG